MLNLNFKCIGAPSQPFSSCINLYKGIYNVTVNDTCKNWENNTPTCDTSFERYYGDHNQHTVVVFIINDISKQVARAVINIYEGKIFQILFDSIVFYNGL